MKKHLGTQPFQETLHQSLCGPASLKIVLDFFGDQKTESELAILCNWNKDYGVDDINIKKAVETLGYQVEIINDSNFKEIEKWLDKKVPVIVNWFTRGRYDYPESDVADGHYSVVEGLDDDYIYLQDPEIGGIRKLKKEDFEKVWFDFSGESMTPENLILKQIIAIYR